MQERIAYLGITFDDVLLEPGYSEIVLSDKRHFTWAVTTCAVFVNDRRDVS